MLRETYRAAVVSFLRRMDQSKSRRFLDHMRPVGDEIDRQSVFGERSLSPERIAPGFFEPGLEAEHIARYLWASHYVSQRAVLDVSCGTGYGSKIMMEAGARRVVGIDIHGPAVEFALTRYRDPSYLIGSAERLPFAAMTFDTVASFETIEHLSHPQRFLEETKRVLKPSGTLLLSTPNRNRTVTRNPHHRQEFDIDELMSLLQNAAMRVVEVLGQRWVSEAWLWRKAWGLRRLAFELQDYAGVIRLPTRQGLNPRYWCVRAVRCGT